MLTIINNELCVGIKVLFQVGLVLLNMAFGTVEKRSRYTRLQETCVLWTCAAKCSFLVSSQLLTD